MFCPECFPLAPKTHVDVAGEKVPEKAAHMLLTVGFLIGAVAIVCLASSAARRRGVVIFRRIPDELLQGEKPIDYENHGSE